MTRHVAPHEGGNNGPEMVRWCLNHGAVVHDVNKDGESALHFAAETGATEIMSALLDAGADLNQNAETTGWRRCSCFRFRRTRSGFFIAFSQGGDRCAKRRRRNCFDFGGSTESASCCARAQSAGANVRAATNPSAGSDTALHFAAQFGYLEIAETLINAEADISAQTHIA